MFKNINIGLRIGLGFIIILLLFIFVYFFTVHQMGVLSNLTSLMYKHPLTVSNAVLRIEYNITRIHRSMKDVALSQNQTEIDQAVNLVNQYESMVYKDFEIIQERFLGDSTMYLHARDLFTQWKPIRDSVITLMDQGKNQQAAMITKHKGAQHVFKLESAMQDLNNFAQNKAFSFYNEALVRRSHSLSITYTLAILVLLAGSLFVVLLTFSITQPLTTLMNAVMEISSGNLKKRIDIQSKDETGLLATAFNQMTEKLQVSHKDLEDKIFHRTIELEKANSELKLKIHELHLAQEDLLLHKQALDNMLEGVHIIKTQDNTFLYMNTASEKMYGYQKSELVDQGFCTIIASNQNKTPKEIALEINQKLLSVGEWEDVLLSIRKDGSQFWAQTKISAFNHSLHGTIGIIVQEDITERKQAEEQIKSALKEKETLLRELYHRTKNNMQVIRSIISLQRAYSQNEELESIFQDTENKIQAMALVHQKLYQSKDLSKINLAEYFQELTDLVVQSFHSPHINIQLDLQLEDVIVLIDTAIPCGLIVNELLSNTLKHAFPDKTTGTITIKLFTNNDGAVELFFMDNGIGVPQNFNFRTQKSLGLQTIITITEHQLKGKIQFSSDNGTTCHIIFNDENNIARV